MGHLKEIGKNPKKQGWQDFEDNIESTNVAGLKKALKGLAAVVRANQNTVDKKEKKRGGE